MRKAPYANPYKLDKRDDSGSLSRTKWVRNSAGPQNTGTVKIAKRENLRKKNQPDKLMGSVIFARFAHFL